MEAGADDVSVFGVELLEGCLDKRCGIVFLGEMGKENQRQMIPVTPDEVAGVVVAQMALISGAFAERVKFSSFLVFILLWSTFIYDPLAHWVWGVGGWLRVMGALDFAGGTVMHIVKNGGQSAINEI